MFPNHSQSFAPRRFCFRRLCSSWEAAARLPSVAADQAAVGSVDLALVAGGVTLTNVSYSISGPNSFSTSGTINVGSSSTISAIIGDLPAGNGYTITLQRERCEAERRRPARRQRAAFNALTAHAVTMVTVTFDCTHQPAVTGSVAVNGQLNVCPVADGISASPADVAVGFPTALAIAAHDADNGPRAARVRLDGAVRLLQRPYLGDSHLRLQHARPGHSHGEAVSDGDSTPGCADTLSAIVTCEPSTLLVPKSLVVSSSTYDRTQGAVASLAIGTKLGGLRDGDRERGRRK